MTSLILAAVLQAQIAAVPEENAAEVKRTAVPQTDYATAFKRSLESGRPLVVLLGARWCPGCVQMKESILPRVAEAGGLASVEYAYVDVDRDPRMARRLSLAAAIPQLIRYEKTEDGWKRDLLTGAGSVKQVASFINPKAKKQPKAESPVAALVGWAKSITESD
jgi:thioredoxin-like negative regulator of GroEL